MENSYKFFENKDCKYHPCHKDIDEINCLFCYCPMYYLKSCPGTPEYIERAGKTIKNCTNCTFPHKAENYDKVIAVLKHANS
ncbi:MAG: metal-binding protein [Eubacterium sp.]|nr:metal-binding protein [Eubacterium sp.]